MRTETETARQNKKKIGYKQFESLLAQAHRKCEILADKLHELQTYFIGYVEYRGDNIKFNSWMEKTLKDLKNESKKNEQSNEQHLEGSTQN
jgi:hypothetical protein